MVDKNQILIKYYREGKSNSCISRELKITRKTVRKYLEEHVDLMHSFALDKELELGLSSKPKYNSATRTKSVLTDIITEEINLCLKKNKEKRNSGLRKQVMQKIDIYDYLKEGGHKISYSTVCNYIRLEESRGKESFIKQVYHPGEICEFDWGEVKVYIKGYLQTFNLAVFTSAYSNYRYAKLFYRQDSLAFSQSHIDFFQCTQGVYKEMVYDNMRVAVKKFVGTSEERATTCLLELSNYYKFSFRFCNIRKGNEKGHVERSVEFIRRKSFSRKDEFSSVEQANEHLLRTCEKLNNEPQKLKSDKTANTLFDDEKPNLFVQKYPYKSFSNEHAKVDKYSTISFQQNRYSVPDYLVGKLLDMKVFAEKIDVYYNNDPVCSHKRSYGAQTWTMDINHYLYTLKRKPGALKGALAYEQLSEDVKEIYEKYFTNSSRDFIELLQYCKENGVAIFKVQEAISQVLSTTPTSVSKDKILTIMDKQKEKIKSLEASSNQSSKEIDEIVRQSKEALKEACNFLN
jgi:transposase